MYFTYAKTGYIGGDAGAILKTTDGGVAGVEETVPSLKAFALYPNPANNRITINGCRKMLVETMISIFTITGKLVFQDTVKNQNQVELNVSTLTKGIYLVKIQTKDGIEVKKLVIE